MEIYIIGATGLVGSEILKLLEKYNLEKVNFIASSQSTGKEILFNNKKNIIKDFDSIKNLKALFEFIKSHICGITYNKVPDIFNASFPNSSNPE